MLTVKEIHIIIMISYLLFIGVSCVIGKKRRNLNELGDIIVKCHKCQYLTDVYFIEEVEMWTAERNMPECPVCNYPLRKLEKQYIELS